MRRALAITLLIVFGLPMAQVFAGLRRSERLLPACCRKGGQHHCSGVATMPGGSPAVMAAPCSSYPAAVAPVRAGAAGASASGTRLELAVWPVSAERPHDAVASCRSAAHPKRGPPGGLL